VIVGVLGGGQLGRMLGLAGVPLGLEFRFLDPVAASPAKAVGELVVGEYTDKRLLAEFAASVDVVTYEFENVPAESVEYLAERVDVYPPSGALRVAQDRLLEKELFTRLGIATPGFVAVNSQAELEAAAKKLGLPAVLKTRRMGYDGKGQAVLRTPADVSGAFEGLGGGDLILESFVKFDREVSVLVARSTLGEEKVYPIVENHHAGGILRLSIAPAPGVTPELQAEAERCARLVVDAVGYVGVLAIEMFEVGGRLVANEMAPRVHNSGHWTIEGARTSQFENHLRAILGWPLGSVEAVGCSAMVNLIGMIPPPPQMLEVPGAHVHLYGKEPRAGRKVGHVTVWRETEREVREGVRRVVEGCGIPDVLGGTTRLL
jgi:5-(carboxyamino)imidazole ribonucleotide synthase